MTPSWIDALRAARVYDLEQPRPRELVPRRDRIEVAERHPLTDLAAIHDQAAAGRLAGKTVLTP